MKFDSRLKKAERSVHGDVPSDVFDCIGQYYDSLDRQQQNRWVQYYYGVDVGTFEKVERACTSVSKELTDWHFICDRKPKPPTDEQLQRARQEIEQFISSNNERNN